MTVIEPFPSVIIPLTVNGNPELNSEELLAYEAGYRFVPTKTMSLDMAVYYNVYDQLISYQQINNTLVFKNNVGGEAYGVELAAEWKPLSWLTTEFNYSYVEVDLA